jgi:SAM-dependent methyltransferase
MTREETAGRLIGVAKRFIPPPGRLVAAQFLDAMTNSLERIRGRKDPMTPPLRIRLHVGPFLDPELYRLSAEQNVEGLRELCGLRRDSRILDLGCGCGRIASALTRYMSSNGSYDGFDVADEAVEWCQRHITARFPNFRFRRIPGFSQRYNPQGSRPISDVAFPYEDNRFDLVFASSLFTHIPPDGLANYIAETRRVLRPGGTILATFCLLTDSSLPIVKAGHSAPPLRHKYGDFWVRDLDDRASFIAYPERFVREMYRNCGLTVVDPIRFGSWATGSPEPPEVLQPFGFSQDIVIAMKAE